MQSGSEEEGPGRRLEWPAEQAAEPLSFRPSRSPGDATEGTGAEEAADEPDPRAWAPPPLVTPVARTQTPPPIVLPPPMRVDDPDAPPGSAAALAAIAARVDVLTATTTTFRNMVSDQVNSYVHHTREMVADLVGRNAEARADARTIVQIGADVAACREGLRDMSAALEELTDKVTHQIGAIVVGLERLTDEVTAIRRRTPVRAREATSSERTRTPRRGSEPR